jgi:photosystem II stability/assembly factor-like uncharacterized protein
LEIILRGDKMKSLYLLPFLLIFNIKNLSQDIWQKTNGPFGGAQLTNIVSNGVNLFGSTNDTVYVSTDNGLTWRSANTGLPDAHGLRNFICLGSNRGSVFAGTFAGVYRSTNNGGSWESISGENGPAAMITSLGFLDTIIIAGSQSMQESGIFCSTDNGVSWARADSFSSNWFVNCFLTKNDTIFAGLNGGGLFRSTDLGKSWEHLDSIGITNNFIAGMVLKNNKIYVGTSAGLFCSENGGASFNILSEFGMLIFTSIGDYFLKDGNGVGVFLSKDDGLTWTPKNSGFIDSYSTWVSQLASINGNLFATTGEGLFISTDTAETWSIVNIRTVETTVHSILAGDDGTLYAATEAGFFRSTNKGKDWIAASTGLPSYIVYCVAIQDSVLLAGTTKGIFRSSDRGNTWLPLNNGLSNPSGIRTIVVNGSDIFAAGNTIYKTTNKGESWYPLNINPAPFSISSIIVDGEKIIAGASNGIFRSSDYGLSWEQANDGLVDKYIRTLLLTDGKLYAGTYSHGVFSSTDYGDKWSSFQYYSLLAQGLHSLAAFNNTLFIVGTDFGTRIYSLKDSSLLEGYNDGFPSIISILSLTIQDSVIFAGSYEHGVWGRQISGLLTGINDKYNPSASEFNLFQNYPNPFNPTTSISYEIAAGSHVTLKVYDILGREIKELVNEFKPAGKYSIQFDGSSLSSGVYFYSITAGSNRHVKKMVLAK